MHDLDSVRELSRRLAQQLGVTLNESREATAQLAAKLASATASTPRLLLLDNGEHLADLGAWVGQLADSAPRLKLLVTSRARLNVRGEHVLPLQGLMLPDEDSRDIDAAPSFDAVRLFATRAAAALPGFSLSQHLPAVIEIVQQCAGWPLAIELAAAWVRLLPPQEIARELRQSIDVLERDPGSQHLPSRPEHASMRAVLEQSFRLLAPREREALEALTVFRGRFTRAAAQAVTSVAIPLLASLVDKSLLEADGSGQFGLHPLVAAEGQQRLLQDTARAARLGERHAEYFLRSLAAANTIVNTETRQAEVLIDAHEADLRRAWHHALELRRGDLVASTLPEWSSFYQRRGRLREGAAMLQPALQWPADGPDGDLVQGRARAAVARLWFMAQEPLETVYALADAGLDHARRAADAQAQSACLAVRASCDSERGRFDLAREGFEQALALAEAQGHVGTAIRCLRNLGSVATRAGDYQTALTYTRRAQMRAREAGHTHAEVDAMFAQAGPLLESADWSGAEQVLRQALQLAAPLGARQLLLNGRCMRGCALIELGRLAEAEDELKQVFRDAGELGQPHLQMYADTYMALAAARGGRLDDAEQALRGVALRASEADWTKEAMRALLFQGEVLARRGDRLAAAAAWRAVAAEASIPAGERDTARRWLAELALSDDESARAEAIVPDAQQALRTHLLRPSAD
jgi:predicted ATPase